MFLKKLLLEIPCPKAPKVSKETILSIIAKMHNVKNEDTLVIDFYNPKHILRIFFQGEKYINYEIENDKFNKKILGDFNYKNYECYIVDIYHTGKYQIDGASETLLLEYFNLSCNSSLRALFEKIKEIQQKQQTDKDIKQMENRQKKYFQAKNLLEQIKIPTLSLSREDIAELKLSDKNLYAYEENGEAHFYCPICGESIVTDMYTAMLYSTQFCECCGNKINQIVKVYKIKTCKSTRYAYQKATVTKLYNQSGVAFSVTYKFLRTIKFEKKSKKLCDGFNVTENEIFEPIELHIFDKGQSYTFAKFEAYDVWNIKYTNYWVYKEKFNIYQTYSELIPFDMKDFLGTAIENSKVDLALNEYLRETKNRYNIAFKIISYLDFYCMRPNIENLFTSGFVKLATETPFNRKEALSALHLKNSKMLEITGLDRLEREQALNEQWDFKILKIYKKVKSMNKILNYSQLTNLSKILDSADNSQYKEIINNLSLIKYLLKQTEKEQSVVTKIYFDYLDMAKELNYDFSNIKIKYPPHLLNAHDSVMRKTKYKPNSERNKKYTLLFEKIKEYEFSLNDYCLKVPKSDYDLYIEGKLLDHCVGGESYMNGHKEGRCIFFIRNTNSPAVPMYTLNFNIKSGQQIQLHGYNNERNGQTIPQSVYDFIAYWKENIFRKFDVDKMEFIEKPKKHKKGSGSAA